MDTNSIKGLIHSRYEHFAKTILEGKIYLKGTELSCFQSTKWSVMIVCVIPGSSYNITIQKGMVSIDISLIFTVNSRNFRAFGRKFLARGG